MFRFRHIGDELWLEHQRRRDSTEVEVQGGLLKKDYILRKEQNELHRHREASGTCTTISLKSIKAAQLMHCVALES